MSAESTPVTQAHFRYVEEHARREDDFLRSLREDAEAAGLPPIHVSPAQGAFLFVLLRAARAREVVEVGTLGGYSAVWMARALPPDGRVRTIEIDPARAAFARERLAGSDVADRVEVLEGDAHVVLAGMPAKSADAAFLDADKAGYPRYFEECLRIVRPGGLILADNAFAFGQLFDEHPTDPEVPAVRAFNDLVAADPRVESVIAPIGDGLWLMYPVPR